MAMRHVESEEGIGQFVNDPDKTKAGLARVIVEAAKAWRASYPDISLPSLAAPASNAASAVETRTATQSPEPEFEIPTVSEGLYKQTWEALAKEGYTFVVDILPVSIGQLAADEETGQRFGHVNSSKNMRAIVSQKMEVAINPNNLRIKKSNSKSTEDQIEMLENEEAALKAKLPQEVRDLISMRMQNASVLAQIDDEYQKETRKVLFTNWFGRTDDQTIPGNVADVGRGGSSRRLDVNDWSRGSGARDVFAVPVVVLPRKLVA